MKTICNASKALVTRTKDLAHTRTAFADESESRESQQALLTARIIALAHSATAAKIQINRSRKTLDPRYRAQLSDIARALDHSAIQFRAIAVRVADFAIEDRDNWAVELRDLAANKNYADGRAALTSLKRAAFSGAIGSRLKAEGRGEPTCAPLLGFALVPGPSR